MPDISKCENIDCPLRKSCYRFACPVNLPYQSYNTFEYNRKTKTCDYYWEVKKQHK